jgi:N-acetylmuramoyl-L-alanine amidase
LIGEDGRVYEGRGWNKVGAHTFGWNKVSVSFAFMGNFEEKEAAPLAISALKGIISYGLSQGLLSTDYKMYGHRDARPTIGPGDKLYSQIQTFDHFDHNKPVKPTN